MPDIGQVVGRTLDTVFELASDAAENARTFLASEQGRALRRTVATAVIVGAPILSELPVIRRSPLARLARTAALGALLVKGAEWLRDWEPIPAAVNARVPSRAAPHGPGDPLLPASP
jgi:hypothetical protein